MNYNVIVALLKWIKIIIWNIDMPKYFLITGNIFLLIGLYLHFKSNHYDTIIMDAVRKGRTQPMVREEKDFIRDSNYRIIADKYYKWGIRLTTVGIFFNIIGILL